jgi:hypothetical protein
MIPYGFGIGMYRGRTAPKLIVRPTHTATQPDTRSYYSQRTMSLQ